MDYSTDDLDPSQYSDGDGNPDMPKIEAEAERRGLNAAEKQGFVADVIRRVSVTVKKAEGVIHDAETGAEYGSVVPVIGTVAGTIGGAVYGVYTEFGDDIKSALSGGPRWSEDDYNRMRKACRDQGGVNVAGKAPNNLDSCMFPDGTLSGGDSPVWDPDAKAFYDADQRARKDNLAQISNYIEGLKKIDGMFAQADADVRKQAKTNVAAAFKARAGWLRGIGNAFGTIYNATKLDSTAPADVAQFLKDNSSRIFTPPLGTFKKPPKPMHPVNVVALATKSKLPAVHMTLIAAKNGDPAAKAVVAATATAADQPGAPKATVQAANAMTLALKMQKRSAYVTYWLYGDGAKKVQPAA